MLNDTTVENGFEIGLVEKATRLAVVAHEGQKRKVDGLPYIIHPFMVALKLSKYGFSDSVVAAAMTHDVLEDTTCTHEQLKAELGNEVYEIVKAVTNDDSLSWEEKKKKYVETVRNGPEGAKAVAVADKIHNIESLLVAYAEQGPGIWTKFNRGKDQKLWFEKEVLRMLRETWDHPLIDEYEKLLEIENKLD
ncbi:HD domain-containing protein [Methanomethylovorans sp.]|uniref:HD domain-containing protein n=1 Tax=Methanomethylovorans sp. TaxID=2758717 RepID=UPI00345E4EFC